jgi:hypothetical protein
METLLISKADDECTKAGWTGEGYGSGVCWTAKEMLVSSIGDDRHIELGSNSPNDIRDSE